MQLGSGAVNGEFQKLVDSNETHVDVQCSSTETVSLFDFAYENK